MHRRCAYAGGCDREATTFFAAAPARGWLCDDHFQQTLDAAAEREAAARRKLDDEWQAHFEKFLRENNLNPADLTETQTRQIEAEVRRWLEEKRVANEKNQKD